MYSICDCFMSSSSTPSHFPPTISPFYVSFNPVVLYLWLRYSTICQSPSPFPHNLPLFMIQFVALLLCVCLFFLLEVVDSSTRSKILHVKPLYPTFFAWYVNQTLTICFCIGMEVSSTLSTHLSRIGYLSHMG